MFWLRYSGAQQVTAHTYTNDVLGAVERKDLYIPNANEFSDFMLSIFPSLASKKICNRTDYYASFWRPGTKKSSRLKNRKLISVGYSSPVVFEKKLAELAPPCPVPEPQPVNMTAKENVVYFAVPGCFLPDLQLYFSNLKTMVSL